MKDAFGSYACRWHDEAVSLLNEVPEGRAR
jgi:hypothetical protein